MILLNVGNLVVEPTKVVTTCSTRRTPTTVARRQASRGKVVDRLQSRWESKFLVDGTFDAPNGTTAVVRTIWIVDGSPGVTRLVTAYPRK